MFGRFKIIPYWVRAICERCVSLCPPAVKLVVQNLPEVYVEKLLPFLAEKLDGSPHLQFYLQWCTAALTTHGTVLKNRASSLMASLRDLQKSIVLKQIDLGKL